MFHKIYIIFIHYPKTRQHLHHQIEKASISNILKKKLEKFHEF